MRDYKTQTWYKLSKSNVARILRCMRTVENSTQAELANAISTTQSGISDLEKGATDPGISTIFRYAEACGFEVDITFRRKKGLQIESQFTLSSADFHKE